MSTKQDSMKEAYLRAMLIILGNISRAKPEVAS